MVAQKAMLLTTGKWDWTLSHHCDNTESDRSMVYFRNNQGQLGVVEIQGEEYTITVDGSHIFQGWESELYEIELLSLD